MNLGSFSKRQKNDHFGNLRFKKKKKSFFSFFFVASLTKVGTITLILRLDGEKMHMLKLNYLFSTF